MSASLDQRRFNKHQSQNTSRRYQILDFISSYSGSGFSGNCGKFAIALNNRLGGIGVFVGAINSKIWECGDYSISHVALLVDGKLYDVNGIINRRSFKAWGVEDEGSDCADLYGMNKRDLCRTEIVDLSKLWGDEVERKVLKWTNPSED